MKKYILLSFFLGIFFVSDLLAHEYHFSFSEIEYNLECGCLQTSISVTAHDMEFVFQKKGLLKGSFQKALKINGFSPEMKKEVFDHFKINIDDTAIKLFVEGYEFSDDGLFYLYLSSDQIKLNKSSVIFIKYDLHMDTFVDQQNKLTFRYQQIKQTCSFLQDSRESSIIFVLPKRNQDD